MMGMQRGYTIIEVMLFLAVSSALFLIAFSYTSATIQNTGFTDDKNQLSKFVQRAYLNVKNSQASRNDDAVAKCNATDPMAKAPGASDTCSVIGSVLLFDRSSDTVVVSSVVGNVRPAVGTATDLDALQSLNPRVLENGSNIVVVERFSSPARLEIAADPIRYRNGATTTRANAVAFLRSPVSEKVFTVTWETTGDPTLSSTYNVPALATRLTPASGVVDKPTLVCYRNIDNPQRFAAVQIANNQLTGDVASQGQTLSRVGMSCG